MHREVDRLIHDLARCPAETTSDLVATLIRNRKLSHVVGELNTKVLKGTETQRATAAKVLEKIGFPM